MKKIATAIIQARMSSSRLPGKVLMNLANKPMLWHIVERLKQCKFVDKIIVATSVETSDDLIEGFCKKENILCFRGSLNNVYQRYLTLIEKYNTPYFVRVTGDCPLICPIFIDKQIIALNSHNADLIWPTREAPMLVGQGVQSSKSLINLKNKIFTKEDKEHVASIYISKNPKDFKIIGMHIPDIFTQNNLRVTVDELEDYQMMNTLYSKLWENKPIKIEEAINLIIKNKIISNKNKFIQDSNINKKVKSKIKYWDQYVTKYCSWSNPREIIED